MRIGILTGGGDVPGLNPCIKALVYRAIDEGHEPIGIRRGWHGLLYYNPDDPATHGKCTLPLDKLVVRAIDRTGGTFLHTSRTNPSRVRLAQAPDFLDSEGKLGDSEMLDFTDHVLQVLEHLKIDLLIPIGGEEDISKKFLFLPDRVICNSRAVAGRFERGGKLPEKVRVILNGVDLEKFRVQGSEFREHMIVGIVSNLTKRKRVEFFLEAASKISVKTDNVSFLVVGGEFGNENSGRMEKLKHTMVKMQINFM